MGSWVRCSLFVWLAYVGLDWIAVLLRLQFIIFLVACCCFSLMNHDVIVSTTLCCRVLTLVCASLYMLFLDFLAHGCPTRTGHWFVGTWLSNIFSGSLRSGTWLPNSTVWHMVAQRTWVPTMCSGLLGCTYYLISINELHTDCDIMRHLLFSGGSM